MSVPISETITCAVRSLTPGMVRRYPTALEKQMEELMTIAGTPKQVIAKLRILLEETRPGILAFWGNDGTVSHEDSKTCIRLLGTPRCSRRCGRWQGAGPEEPVRGEPAGGPEIPAERGGGT